MLIYHPVYDINHCIYRFLRILETSRHSSFAWDLFRLLDFYSVFPHLLKNIKPFPRELSAYKKVLNRIDAPYESMPNHQRVFHEILNIQNTAVHNLIAKNLITADAFCKQVVQRSEENLPANLKANLDTDPVITEGWYRFLVDELPTIPLKEKMGLKQRSQLLEYRYDSN